MMPYEGTSTPSTTTDSRIGDLEAKLYLARRKVEEFDQKCHSEARRREKAEREMQLHQDDALRGGTDLEYQLMENMLALDNRRREMENLKRDSEEKVLEIEEQLRLVRGRREGTERELVEKRKEAGELAAKLEELRLRATGLQNEAQGRKNNIKEMKNKSRYIERERDEMLQILENAVEEKEIEKRNRMQEAAVTEEELSRRRQAQAEERLSMRKMLSNVDNLLAKVGRGSNSTTEEAAAELGSIRETLRRHVRVCEDENSKYKSGRFHEEI